jgi:23S rRNA (uracil1939-C5)-methyltransferase
MSVEASAGSAPAEPEVLSVTALDLEARGVARQADGKVVFIEGALPFELVTARLHRHKNQWAQGVVSRIDKTSPFRVRPGCPHFGLHAGACGGCKMQHLDLAAQVAVKQRVLEDDLAHLARVKPDQMLAPIAGPAWGYRYRARLSVRHVPRKGGVLVGFHERQSRYVADMGMCPVLPPKVSGLIGPLRELIGQLALRDRIPQLELAAGEQTLALVVRHLEPVPPEDRALLLAFARQHGVQWWLQSKGPDTVHPLDPADAELFYDLPAFDLRMHFRPTDFTQVNPHINRVLVSRAVRMLEPLPGERVIDWFCGLGNFTLPLARSGAQVLGIEGSETLVARAREGALAHGLQDHAHFEARNLFETTAQQLVQTGPADRWLVDPPREGAFALAKALADLAEQPQPGWQPPRRIVYVSCNPATLARDAGLLVHQAGYRCSAAGVVNMFPHTAHVESMAVFDLQPSTPPLTS